MRILILKNDKYYLHNLKHGKLSKGKQVKGDPDINTFVSSEYLLKNYRNHALKLNSLLKYIEYDKIYFKVADDEDLFWFDIFEKCKKCVKECKQSHIISGLHCNEFQGE